MRNKQKIETVNEFLARGGKITICPPKYADKMQTSVNSTIGGPISMMTLDEAEFFFSEEKPSKSKSKTTKPTLNVDALPESLKKKFISRLQD